jgi:UDP-N-acetylglucosamine--N-acetylmuramyl-(pentapeptide) pyrophosphoryl-undecaprenol N-acetylglucosamine transferase
MNLLFTGGGTGGHVYPAIALAECLRRRDPGARVLFVGGAAGMEARLVPQSGMPFTGLVVRPPRGRSPVRAAVAAATAAASVGQALPIVIRFRPAAIVATGGLAALPVVAAGWALRVPVVVVEGNMLPGRVSRVLARWSRAVAVPRGGTAPLAPSGRVFVTGLPVRAEIYSTPRARGLEAFGLDGSRRTLLVIGGSQGAARVNAAVEGALTRLRERSDLQVLHVSGGGWGTARAPDERRSEGGVLYVRTSYLERMDLAYACADLVVSRCGATSLAEITAVGLPSILVPYRYAAEDHQAWNARPLVAASAAVLLPDASLDGDSLARTVTSILDRPGRLEEMAAQARSLGRRDAAEQVLALVERVSRPQTVSEAAS